MAAELRRELELPTTPVVVLSCPARANGMAVRTDSPTLRAIYQGAPGPGRSLDDLFAAARLANGVRITIRVTGMDRELLRQHVRDEGLAERIEIAEPIPPDSLVEGLHDFDVGLIIDRPLTRNNELALPNKLFEYLMAGLAVVAPELPSLGRLISDAGVGLTFTPGDVGSLADVLTRLATDRSLLQELRDRARSAALDGFNAEAQSSLLIGVWSPS
jgi:glycosyltransferase involved in cell wall biosynthesis